MLTATDTADWTEEQHLAAAAALGAYAALVLKLGAHDDFQYAKGLCDGRDMAARWAAVDAARHVRYAERKATRKAAALLRKVCAWCKVTMQEGAPGADTSHGMCPQCELQSLAELAAEDAARWNGTMPACDPSFPLPPIDPRD